MTNLPESYFESMPSDPDLLVDLGRVVWAAARLHAGVRDVINAHHGEASDAPFERTLGQAISELEQLARSNGRADQASWAISVGRPAARRRNAVLHAVTYTAPDGKQAMHTVDHSPPGRFQAPQLRDVTSALIEAHSALPQ